ncbi:unnamed protein product [Nezara viridula]|uniref:Peroxisomal leader peptide-processing protease n=1 Tax=Nezara viridula TaxID=85310 RepID=A0A9P0EEI8_NEZVI|nr:unnamed protein product [Nezara viridula]
MSCMSSNMLRYTFLFQRITGVSLVFTYHNYEINQSGILFNDYVLTTGGLVLPYVLSKKVPDVKDFSVKISLEKRNRVISKTGYIAYVCNSDDLNNSMKQNDFGLDSIIIESFSQFVIIEINNTAKGNFSKIEMTLNPNELNRGKDVLTVSTPFGNQMFLNCYSRGIVSKIVDKGMFITDSRLSPACEGGPIYIINGSIKLVGLVLTQLMVSNEYTGFNLCCNFYILYEAYCRHRGMHMISPLLSIKKEEHPIHRVSDSVLPVKTPSLKGSCISLDGNGLLVTCSHVINYGNNTPVEVTFGGESYNAKILCCSSKDDILDLAFLQINPDTPLPSCTFYDKNPIKGEAVYVVGYKYFWDNSLQLVSKGTVLKHEEQGPIYTSCITHSGNSGGGMFEKDGKLMAIVCGILFEENISTSHHCHNVGIPIKVMKKPIDAYIQTGDISHLESLCKTKDLYLSTWHLFTRSKL